MPRAAFYPPSGVYADAYAKDMRVIKTPTQWVLALFGLLLLFALPLIPGLNAGYYLRLVIGAGITVVICLGLNILTGYAGQLNVGQSAFVMVGAFTSGRNRARLLIGGSDAEPPSIMNIQFRASRTHWKYWTGSAQE